MSDPESGSVTALGGVWFEGFAKVREIGPIGMISLRAMPDLPGLAKAVMAVTGTGLPAQRRIEVQGGSAAGWMSPDEYLLILPYADVKNALGSLDRALNNHHYLAVDVSDARAVFRIEGARANQVLAKVSPVDLDQLAPDELRRSRVAQVAAAFWKDADGFTLVCFRSVAGYVFDLLRHSAMQGSELDQS